MVIQRNKPVHVWGWASPGEKVTVTLAYASNSNKANKFGKWEVYLPAMPAGGPYTLAITGKNTLKFEDVMSGEVWICSGQSNMEWPLRLAKNAKEEISTANNPLIRHFKVPLKTSFSPKDDIDGGEWQVCSPATAGNFTAVGYFFAVELYKELKIPVGLVNASWGGTNVETWISHDAFFGNEIFTSLRAGMPVNGDSIEVQKRRAVDQRIRKLQDKLPTPEEEKLFSQFEYNDSAWKTMTLPSTWENAGLPDIDGSVWFRKNFFLPAQSERSDAILSLGTIDDIDSTYVNGVFVGSTSGWDVPRVYKINQTLLRGENVVSIKVIDNGGGGGLYGNAQHLYFMGGNQPQSLEGMWKFRIAAIKSNPSVGPNDYPTLLYNSMIHPLTPYKVAGVIWYQGESNAGRATEYKKSFPLMISNWRQKWNDELPFYFVQLANFQANSGTSQNGGSTWAELREAQTATLQLPNTGMAVSIDIGDSKDIHPINKQDVGKRLAANALAKTYSRPRMHQGPIFTSMRREGKQVILSFQNVENGWQIKNKYGYIHGFEIAGADQQFKFAKAYISGNMIVVSDDTLTEPVAVRYGWADDPDDLNLYNTEGFPAIPFRTDAWKAKTDGVKYGF